MSAHPASQRGGLWSAMASAIADYLLEPVDEVAETEPIELEPYPVLAVVSAARGSGATSVARLLAAELGWRHDGSALVIGTPPRRYGPPARAAVRLATAIGTAAEARPIGRICVAARPEQDSHAPLVNAARYLAPVVIDVPPDGSAAALAGIADRTVVVAGGGNEPALVDAVAMVLGGGAIKVANRVADVSAWHQRVDLVLPDARLAARAGLAGARALGPLGAGISRLADLVER